MGRDKGRPNEIEGLSHVDRLCADMDDMVRRAEREASRFAESLWSDEFVLALCLIVLIAIIVLRAGTARPRTRCSLCPCCSR